MGKEHGIKLVMRDVKNWWKTMNLKPILLVFFIFMNLILIEASTLEITIRYDYNLNTFLLNFTKLVESNLPGGIRDESIYRWVAYAINDSIIDKGNIIIPGPLIVEKDFSTGKPAEVIYPNSSLISVFLNYNPKISRLIIHDMSDEMLNVNLIQYNRCNLNNICDENENKLLCPEDCYNSDKDGVCQNIEDGVCNEDPDCVTEDPDCIIEENKINIAEENKEDILKEEDINITTKDQKENSNLLIKFIIFVGILLIIIILILVLLSRQKNRF